MRKLFRLLGKTVKTHTLTLITDCRVSLLVYGHTCRAVSQTENKLTFSASTSPVIASSMRRPNDNIESVQAQSSYYLNSRWSLSVRWSIKRMAVKWQVGFERFSRWRAAQRKKRFWKKACKTILVTQSVDDNKCQHLQVANLFVWFIYRTIDAAWTAAKRSLASFQNQWVI